MLKKLIKSTPFLYSSALYFKHQILLVKTIKAYKGYLNQCSHPKLQIGAGQNKLPGWFNTDYFSRPGIFFLNVNKKFPFDSEIFESVFSEHHIEHITYRQARFMLSEVFRTLKPGGHIKITTPDLKKYIYSYAEKSLETPIIKSHVEEWIYGGFAYAANYTPANDYYDAHFINDIFLNYEHRFIYDPPSLAAILEKAGFINIKQLTDFSESASDPEITESHNTGFDKLFTLYMYAEKPLS